MEKFLVRLTFIMALCNSCEEAQVTTRPIVLQGATILDGNGHRLENSILIVKNGKIDAIEYATVSIPEDAEIIDVTGKFITPGLVDAHVHFAQTGFVDGRPDALDIRDSLDYVELQARLQTQPDAYFEAYLRSGVTAVYDVGGFTWSIGFQKSAEKNTRAPHVAATGPLLTPMAQEDLETFNTPGQKQLLHLSSPEIGRQSVILNSEIGSTGIKIWQIDLNDEEFMSSLQAVADEIHKRGNKLVVHATSLDQAKAALELGAKVLVHSVEDREVDIAFLAAAKKQDVIYIPTLTVLKGYYNVYRAFLEGGFNVDDPNNVVDPHTRALLEGARGFAHLVDTTMLRQGLPRIEQYIRYSDSIMALNLYKVYKSGIRIAPGTDAGNPGTLHGISIHDELEAMQDAGIPASELLVMATRNGAAAMERSSDLGTLEVGKQADLLIIEKDPSADISNLRLLTHVMRSGKLWAADETFGEKEEQDF